METPMRLSGQKGFVHRRMQEVADIAPLCQGTADERGADFQHRRVCQAHARRQRSGIDRIAGTGIDQKGILRQDAFRLVPPGENRPVVGPDDEVERVLGIGALQLVQRMDGVGRARQVELEVGGSELGVTRHGKPHQLQAKGIGHQPLACLQRVVGRDEKPHLVQALELAQVVGKRQMSDVNRIE